MYVRFPSMLLNVEGLPFERGIGICHDLERYLIDRHADKTNRSAAWAEWRPSCRSIAKGAPIGQWLRSDRGALQADGQIDVSPAPPATVMHSPVI